MSDFWRNLSYAHISASKLDSIYEKDAKEDLAKILEPSCDMPLLAYLEKAICDVDRYAKKMLKFAAIGRDSSDGRRFSIAYDVAELYLSELTERFKRYEHIKDPGPDC